MKCPFCGKELKFVETCVFMCKHGDLVILFIAGNYGKNVAVYSIDKWDLQKGTM